MKKFLVITLFFVLILCSCHEGTLKNGAKFIGNDTIVIPTQISTWNIITVDFNSDLEILYEDSLKQKFSILYYVAKSKMFSTPNPARFYKIKLPNGVIIAGSKSKLSFSR